MTETIILLISKEILKPTFAMTAEYLEEFKVDYKDGLPVMEHIDFYKEIATAYVKIKNESFFLKFIFEIIYKQIELRCVDTAPLFVVNFSITSEKYEFNELLSMTTIKPTETFRKGDRMMKDRTYSYNGFCFESFKWPGTLTDKLNNLLDILESDKKGIRKLIKVTKCNDVWLTIVYYNGYGIFTELSLPKKIIQRLSSLGLELVFDIYATPYPKQNKK